MRLDLFLKVSRLVKRRTLAHEFCEKGWIEINGFPAKPGKIVKEKDKITINLGTRKKEVEILKIPLGSVSSKEAYTLYKVISDVPKDDGIMRGGGVNDREKI